MGRGEILLALRKRKKIMAITVTSPQTTVGFIKNATTADASACEEIIPAPPAGVNIRLRHVTINSAAANTITLGAGVSGGGVEAALLGPISFGAGTTLQWEFEPLLHLPAAKSLTIDASAPGVVTVFCQGFIE